MARVTVEDCLKKVPSRFALVYLAIERVKQLMRLFPAKLQEVIAFALKVELHLIYKRRDEIKGDLGRGSSIKAHQHVIICLDSVETHPWHCETAACRVKIKRLVHVPYKGAAKFHV